ncbi:pesticin C-terminus-like muramidase [Luteimonas sp. R10]|uniref:pesticin C-terminus-like muramidase n=1 Tax=Luteimonas sp. R10 TaxID=3108176 RepID=UPI00308E8374|nr:pesticin C-terminus-like muramidase [Luteimonas sp. R10]
MKKLTPDELKTIAGSTVSAEDESETFPPITVTGTPPPPSPPSWPPPSWPPPSPPSPPGGGGSPPPPPPPGPPPNPNCENPANEIDFEALEQFEGPQATQGYVPRDANGNPHANSGVTVATGVDLFGRTQASMAAIGIPQPLINTLLPYTTQQGAAADAVAGNLVITPQDADTLDSLVRAQFIADLQTHYNGAAAFADFFQLPANVQTVIYSVAYQHGIPGIMNETPNFWTQVTTGDWQGAYDNLMNFGDDFPTRRQAEAAMLLEEINNDDYVLPTPQNPC